MKSGALGSQVLKGQGLLPPAAGTTQTLRPFLCPLREPLACMLADALHMEGHANLLELVHLASLVPLPNMTLLISLNDDPPDFNEPEKRQGKPPIPVFSIAKGFQHPAMLIPNTGHDRWVGGQMERRKDGRQGGLHMHALTPS